MYNFETKQVRVPALPLGANPMQWSPFSRQNYSVLDGDTRIGIGLHPIFDVVPGAWNLLWLSWPGIDDLIYWSKDSGSFPYHTDILPAVVASCLQMCCGGGSYGVAAECLAPVSFLKFVEEEGKKNPFMLMMLYGTGWVDVALERAGTFKAQGEGGTIIPFDLSRRRQ